MINPLFKPYEKINALFKRDQKGNIIWWDYATPEIGYLAETPWIWTEKVDGTNIRLGWDHLASSADDFGGYIGGRTDKAQIPPSLLTVLNETMCDIVDSMDETFADADAVTLYGEGYGSRIQKGGGKYRPDNGFVLFDAKVNTPDGEWWLRREDLEDVASRLHLDIVPVVRTCSLLEAIDIVKNNEFASAWPDQDAPEGLVGRPAVCLLDRKGKRITTKVKHRDVAVRG